MADLASAVNAAFAYANEPTDSTAVFGQPSEAFQLPGPRDVLEVARNLESPDELNELLRRVAPCVGVPDPFKAAIMSLLCGTLVEWGANVDELSGLLLARLPSFLAAAEHIGATKQAEPSEELFATDPDGVRAWQSLSLMSLAAMAVLTRSVVARQAARCNPELVMSLINLRDHNREANFVATTLSFTDDMELLVLHPGEGRGFRVGLEAVNTNFHLFTLLQGELIGGGYLQGDDLDEKIQGLATGEIPHEELTNDRERFHFYNWAGLLPDGSLAGQDTQTWIWGETHPDDIPEFEGTRVVILGPPVLGMRAWDSNFFANIHDALRSAARVKEELSAEEVAQWVERIRQAPR